MSAQKTTYGAENSDFAGNLPFPADYANHRELTNHLGNVLAVVSDRKIAVEDLGNPGTVEYYEADIVSAQDYYPFGMIMPGRSVSAGEYRYGHQGQESDDEIYGVGNAYAYNYRMSDARLGRFWSIDPKFKTYPWNSPYLYADNRVIDGLEMEGLQHKSYVVTINDQGEAIQKVNHSSDMKDVGPRGWGSFYSIRDEAGDFVGHVFTPEDPPTFFFASGGAYFRGTKVLSGHDEFSGEDGFHGGGKQALTTTLMLPGISRGLKGASVFGRILSGAGLASAADDLLGGRDTPLSQEILGDDYEGAISLTKGTLNFLGVQRTISKSIQEGIEPLEAITSGISAVGGLESYRNAYQSSSQELTNQEE
jgi:RHS repeat-associated protein